MSADPSGATKSCAIALACLLACSCAAEESGPWSTPARAALPLSERFFFTEPLRAAPDQQYRVVLSGTFHFAHDGRTYDALYVTDDAGRFTRRHHYVVFTPSALPLAQQDAPGHRYVFTVPAELARSGRSIGVGLDLPRMVREFVLSPEEIVAGITGEMEIEIQRRVGKVSPDDRFAESKNAPPRQNDAMTAHYWVAALALLACALGIWHFRRTSGLSRPLRGQLRRIRVRHAQVQALLRQDEPRFQGLAGHVSRLREGAEALARQMQYVGRLQDGLEAETLGREIAELEQQHRIAERAELQHEIKETLAEKRRLFEALSDTRTRQARYALRLSKIEAVLEATRLAVPALAAVEDDLFGPLGNERQQQIADQIQCELRTLEEALEEISATG